MGTKKHAKKQRKQSQKQAGKARAVKEKFRRRIAALKEDKRLLELQVANLQRQLKEALESRRSPEISDESLSTGTVAKYRIPWENYTYLQDRYDVYTEKGVIKEEARTLANRDLMKRFGKEAGFTDQQLECIFL